MLIPVLEELAGWDPTRIRRFFEANGFALREWDKVQTDTLKIYPAVQPAVAAARGVV